MGKRAGKKHSLKYSMMNMIAFGWLLPLTVIILVVTVFVSGRLNAQMDRTISTTAEKAAEICTLRLQDCVTQSKELSYNTRLAEIYGRYQKDGDVSALYADTTQLLEEKYKFNQDFLMTGLYYTDRPDRVYFTGNQQLKPSERFFKSSAEDLIQKAAESLETRTELISIDGHIYLLRNVMARGFTPYAVLFMELDGTRVFESLQSVWQYRSFAVYANQNQLMKDGEGDFASLAAEADGAKGTAHLYGSSQIYVKDQVADNPILYAVSFDRAAVNAEQQAPTLLLAILLLFMFPLVFIVVRFFNQRVSSPIQELSDASAAIAEGNYGVTVPVHDSNGEIASLDSNFNAMSNRLKTQFEKIYLEEIALRDANLHAMQSQINPHFLNNTLEIINWEARMGENEKVSNMIESLSVMMAATTDRDRKPLIPLSEEMSYVQAYLYIIQCRYGTKFRFEQEINEQAMSFMVPRLIIQPIIENAVEHGRDSSGTGMVSLRIEGGSTPESDLSIVITNRGVPTAQEMEKIRALLSEDGPDPEKASHIGIRNVNRRLKLIYGSGSGLTIVPDASGNTVSTILIKK